ncbi:unnamed protein product, partial [Prorocentrum cordatum]
ASYLAQTRGIARRIRRAAWRRCLPSWHGRIVWLLKDTGRTDAELLAWFDGHACSLVRCEVLPPGPSAEGGAAGDGRLLELSLENEAPAAEAAFARGFPGASVRRATRDDRPVAEARAVEVVLAHTFARGSGSDLEVPVTYCGTRGGGTGARVWPGGVLLAEWLAAGGLELRGRSVLDTPRG